MQTCTLLLNLRINIYPQTCQYYAFYFSFIPIQIVEKGVINVLPPRTSPLPFSLFLQNVVSKKVLLD